MNGGRWQEIPTEGAVMNTASISAVFSDRADTDVVRRIWALIAETRHHIGALSLAALIPFAAFLPNRPPLLKGEQENDPACFGSRSLSDVLTEWRAAPSATFKPFQFPRRFLGAIRLHSFRMGLFPSHNGGRALPWIGCTIRALIGVDFLTMCRAIRAPIRSIRFG